MPNSIKRLTRFALVGFLAALLTVVLAQPSTAQFSLPEGLGQSSGLNPPPEVTRLGSIEVATVHSPISGEELFEIASPTIYNRNAEGVDLTAAVERRAEEVNARLRRAIIFRGSRSKDPPKGPSIEDPLIEAPPMDPESLSVAVGTLNGVTVITAQDDYYTQPLVLVTITQVDADYHGIPIDQLAQDWRNILEAEIKAGLQELSDEEVLQDLLAISRNLLGLAVITAIFLLAKYLVKRYQRRLYQRKKEIQASKEPAAPEGPVDPQESNPKVAPEEQMAHQRNNFLQGFDEVLSLDRRLSFLSFIQWLLFWVLILIWYLGVYQLFRQFPVGNLVFYRVSHSCLSSIDRSLHH